MEGIGATASGKVLTCENYYDDEYDDGDEFEAELQRRADEEWERQLAFDRRFEQEEVEEEVVVMEHRADHAIGLTQDFSVDCTADDIVGGSAKTAPIEVSSTGAESVTEPVCEPYQYDDDVEEVRRKMGVVDGRCSQVEHLSPMATSLELDGHVETEDCRIYMCSRNFTMTCNCVNSPLYNPDNGSIDIKKLCARTWYTVHNDDKPWICIHYTARGHSMLVYTSGKVNIFGYRASYYFENTDLIYTAALLGVKTSDLYVSQTNSTVRFEFNTSNWSLEHMFQANADVDATGDDAYGAVACSDSVEDEDYEDGDGDDSDSDEPDKKKRGKGGAKGRKNGRGGARRATARGDDEGRRAMVSGEWGANGCTKITMKLVRDHYPGLRIKPFTNRRINVTAYSTGKCVAVGICTKRGDVDSVLGFMRDFIQRYETVLRNDPDLAELMD